MGKKREQMEKFLTMLDELHITFYQLPVEGMTKIDELIKKSSHFLDLYHDITFELDKDYKRNEVVCYSCLEKFLREGVFKVTKAEGFDENGFLCKVCKEECRPSGGFFTVSSIK